MWITSTKSASPLDRPFKSSPSLKHGLAGSSPVIRGINCEVIELRFRPALPQICAPREWPICCCYHKLCFAYIYGRHTHQSNVIFRRDKTRLSSLVLWQANIQLLLCWKQTRCIECQQMHRYREPKKSFVIFNCWIATKKNFSLTMKLIFPLHLYAFHKVFTASFVSFTLEVQPVTKITLFKSRRNLLWFHNSSGNCSGTEYFLYLVIKTKFICLTWGATFLCGFILSLESAVEPTIRSHEFFFFNLRWSFNGNTYRTN